MTAENIKSTLLRMLPGHSDRKPRKVLFRVTSASPRLASVRYRAMLPATGLRNFGFECEINDHDVSDKMLRELSCVVFVKAFRYRDLHLALRARARGVPVILDLCDNIFVPNYDREFGKELVTHFRSMAELASAIVTPSESLGAIIRKEVPNCAEVVEIGDPAESRDLVAALLRRYDSKSPLERPRTASVHAIKAARLLINDPSTFNEKVVPILASKFRAFARRAGGALNAASSSKSTPGANADATRAAGQRPRPKTLLWFGNHGAAHGEFGMLTLLPLLPSLIRVARTLPIKLVIISNSREKFDRYFSKLPFASEYREWDPLDIFDQVKAADVCLMPNSGDAFSLTKSSNRAVLALQHGTPVVATDTPSLTEFADCIALDAWERGIIDYLFDAEKARRDVANGRILIENTYALPVISRRWAELIDKHIARASREMAAAPKTVLVVINRISDAEVLLPVVERLQFSPERETKIWMPVELALEAPRVLDTINRQRFAALFGTRAIPGLDILPGQLRDVSVTVTTQRGLSDACVAQIASWTQKRGAKLYGVQSDVNDGLSPSTAGNGPRPDVSLVWAETPVKHPAQLGAPQTLVVGCPRLIASGGPDDNGQRRPRSSIAVIDDVYRPDPKRAWQASAQAIDHLLDTMPGIEIVFVPHPHDVAEVRSFAPPRWSQHVTIVDLDGGDSEPQLPDIIANAAVVIAAPTNAVLDAARSDRPVAVNTQTAANIVRDTFAPLPLLSRQEDWGTFVGGVLAGRDDRSLRRSFAARTAGPANAAERIVEALEQQEADVDSCAGAPRAEYA